jgi:DNA repair protein RecO (recombination protein O)
MSLIKTKAIVIKSIKWGDTSKIVTLYTREYGCVKVIAKGSRRIKSVYTGSLEALNSLEALIYFSPNRELQTLGQISLENSFQQLRVDLEKMAYALSILELIHIFIHYGEKNQIFFDFVYHILNDIQKTKSPKLILWYFMLKLASYLGFKPEFKICKTCNRNINQRFILFKNDDGSVLCNRCAFPEKHNNFLSRKVVDFLHRLQNTHYKKVLDITYPEDDQFKYTEFIISYLQFHTNQSIKLDALQYFCKDL